MDIFYATEVCLDLLHVPKSDNAMEHTPPPPLQCHDKSMGLYIITSHEIPLILKRARGAGLKIVHFLL